MIAPDDPRHGTTAGFAANCRCTPCREARNADERQRRKYRQVFGIQRLIDGTGTTRRIQALWAIGWTSADIARECGWGTPQAVTEIVATRNGTYRATAATVAAAYERLCMTPGPSNITRARALRAGYAPPLAWDDIDDPNERPQGIGSSKPRNTADPVVVQRILGGEWRLPANVHERRQVVAQWAGDMNELERLTGWNVWRLRSKKEAA